MSEQRKNTEKPTTPAKEPMRVRITTIPTYRPKKK